MNDQPTNPSNQAVPAWFADTANIAPPTPQPIKPKKKLPVLAIGILIIVAVIGAVGWYIFAINSAKTTAFQEFQNAYAQLETNLVSFDDITEPENLRSGELTSSWKAYVSAIETLKTTSLYEENQQLISDIESSSLAYETYANQVVPPLTRYLGECYMIGDETMYNATCRGYVQTALDSGDTLSKDALQTLLAVLVQLSQDNNLSQERYDSIIGLQEKIFAVGRAIQTTVRPKIDQLGQTVGVDPLPKISE